MLNWRDYKHVADRYRVYDAFGSELDFAAMWEDLYDRFGAAPDGTGNIVFDTEEGRSMFVLCHSKQRND